MPPVVGDKFASFEELQGCVSKWGHETYTLFLKNTASKLETEFERHPTSKLASYISALPDKKDVIKRLQYHKVSFICAHGGKHIPKGKGIRETSTRKIQCPVKIYAICKGSELSVQTVEENHNHEVSEESFKMLPENRRLHPSDQKKVCDLMASGLKSDVVRAMLERETNKYLTRDDLCNIRRRSKSVQPSGSQHFSDSTGDRDPQVTPQAERRPVVALTRYERYMTAVAVTNQIASLTSEATGAKFNAMVGALNDALQILTDGNVFSPVVAEDSDSPLDSDLVAGRSARSDDESSRRRVVEAAGGGRLAYTPRGRAADEAAGWTGHRAHKRQRGGGGGARPTKRRTAGRAGRRPLD